MNFFKKIIRNISKERQCINLFRQKGALSYNLAVDPKELENINISIFNKLVRKRVIERGDINHYFLNERELLRYRMEKSKWGMIILLGLLGMIILIFNR